MEPIRILQVFTIMNRGGAESMIMNYYRHIDRTKVQFDFLVHRKESAAYDEEIESLGGCIYRMPPINPFAPKKYYDQLRAFFREKSEYKIVHSHLNTFSSFPLKIAQEFSIPCRIAHAHIAIDKIKMATLLKGNESLSETLKKIIKLYLKTKVKTYATHYFSCGKKAGTWLFGPHTSFEIMNNAIDVAAFSYDETIAHQYRKKLGIENKFVIGHIGRFTSQKNHDFLLKVFAEVQKEKKDTLLLLVGDGPLREKNEQLAKELKISENVMFLGVRPDIAALCQVMDVFVFPSFYEGLPVTLIEAQAAGIKVITSTAITNEIVITNNVTQISLEEPIAIWTSKILSKEFLFCTKENHYKEIAAHNFDIKSNAKQAEIFYLTQSSPNI